MNAELPVGTTRKSRRQFDRTAALQTAMELFWRHGYEATSMSMLLGALKLTAPSLYMAFGNKDQLFREAVEYYGNKYGARVLAPLQSAPTAREAMEQMLMNSADLVSSGKNPHGCLISFGAINSANAAGLATTLLKSLRADVLNRIRKRLEAAVQTGELKPATDVRRLARYFLGAMGGIQLQSLDGATTTDLRALARDAMLAWPAGRSAGAK